MGEEKLKTFVVIGLGVFGQYVVKFLSEFKNINIIGIDKDENKVEDVKEYLKIPVVCDASDMKQLTEAGVDANEIDVAIVAIGESVESSIYVTLLLKELGIKKIVARALNNQHAKILGKIGVDKIVYPEALSAEQLVKNLLSPQIVDEFNLSEEYSIAEVVAPKEFYNKSLQSLGVRTKYKVTVLGIKRKMPVISDTGETDLKEEIILLPSPEEKISEGDILIVAGRNVDIERLRKV
ncbi:MAG: potassium channel family protein [Endomicrobiia bacterium]